MAKKILMAGEWGIQTTFRYYVRSDVDSQLRSRQSVQMFRLVPRLKGKCFCIESSGRGGGAEPPRPQQGKTSKRSGQLKQSP